MFKNLFKKNNNNINSTAFKVEILVASLLIHAAKMDQNYSVDEKNIITASNASCSCLQLLIMSW